MKEFDKSSLTALRIDLEAALVAVAQKHGVTLTLGTCRYSPTDAHYTRLSVNLPTGKENGVGVNPDAAMFIKYAEMYGVQESDLGRIIRIQGKEFQLVGLKPKRSKYPFLAKLVSTGTVYKLAQSQVKAALEYANA